MILYKSHPSALAGREKSTVARSNNTPPYGLLEQSLLQKQFFDVNATRGSPQATLPRGSSTPPVRLHPRCARSAVVLGVTQRTLSECSPSTQQAAAHGSASNHVVLEKISKHCRAKHGVRCPKGIETFLNIDELCGR